MKNRVGALLLGLGLLGLGACTKAKTTTNSSPGISAAKLTPGSFVPSSSIVSGANVKGTVSVKSTNLYYSNIGMVRFNDPWGSKEVLVDLGTYDANTDFGGPNGSITLEAETQNYSQEGGAYPVLTSFSVVSPTTGTTEFVKLTSGCAASGMWICTNGSCVENPSCDVQAASAFGGRSDWDQHQVPPYGYSTTNSFPRCDSSLSSWACPGSGGLPSGHYYAKYLLLSDSGNSVSNLLAGLKINMVIRKDTSTRNTGSIAGSAGATPCTTESNCLYGGINLNLILVGDQNINDSHSTQGARNLNLLIKEANRLLLESGAKLGINQVKTYEWSNANGGSQYAQVNYQDLGTLFEAGSKGVSTSDSGQAINIFLVSDIGYAGSNFTILGVSGAILGPPVNGTQTSGLVFSSFDQLATFNPNCSSIACSRDSQENDFLEMAATIVHELGHYLGLNHPSEKPDSSGNQSHDFLADTPTCAARSTGLDYRLDQRACISDTTKQFDSVNGSTCQTACNAASPVGYYYAHSYSIVPDGFCPQVNECQFNHIMWYTTKNRVFRSGAWQEDGNLFSPMSSALLQWNSYVR